MTKQEKFLWIVQTIILANGVNLSSRPETANLYQKEYSAAGVLISANEALAASERIPSEMSASDAAHQFCTYTLLNLREVESKGGAPMQVPYWFARS